MTLSGAALGGGLAKGGGHLDSLGDWLAMGTVIIFMLVVASSILVKRFRK